jgi:hypothetical protein
LLVGKQLGIVPFLAGVELKSAGNTHKKQLRGKRGGEYSIAPCSGRP